jgi:glycolate oxidase FAD binding subunit
MLLCPKSLPELQALLADARQKKQRVTGVVLDAFTGILEHNPEDMTVSLEAGITLQALQDILRKRGQWLPIDPPKPALLTISDLLQQNLSGPRRYGCGTIREHLIGLKAMLPDGKVVKSGGKVVKNVAGYDLQKIFVGSHGSLGIILEAIFKLRPLPATEQLHQCSFATLSEACAFARKIMDSALEPVVLDLYGSAAGKFVVVVGFGGTPEEVEWQNNIASGLGSLVACDLSYEEDFWRDTRPVHKASVLPTRLQETIERIGPSQFVARAGNGVLYYRGGTVPASSATPLDLMGRIKDTFDPDHILPDLPL